MTAAGPRYGVQLGMNGYGPFGWWPEEDLPRVLAVVRDTGFDGVEMMTDVLAPGDAAVRRALEDAGLAAAAVHVFLHEVETAGALERLLDTVEVLGSGRLIASAANNRTRADFERLATTLDGLGGACRPRGIHLLFHPHHAEFRPVRDDEGVRGVELLRERCDPDLVGWNVDFYWAYRGGADPVDVARRFGPVSGYYHVRDGDERHSALLGEGELDVPGYLRAVAEVGLDGAWLVYEDPEPKLPPSALCRRTLDYIRAAVTPGEGTAT